MDIDESKNEHFLAVNAANEACSKARRQLQDALSISDAHAKQFGSKIRVSGATRATPPQPREVELSPGQEYYEIAQEYIKLFEVFKRLSEH
jgi:hypothetical protein